MDAGKFKESPGRLARITVQGSEDWAFVPDPLPPNWTIPDRLWPHVVLAKQLIGELGGVGRTLPNPTLLLRPLSTHEAIRSSRLEGTYVTSRELFLFELDRPPHGTANDLDQSSLEVFNYKRALDLGTNGELPLSLRLIRDMHAVLLQGVRGRDRSPGSFRKDQVAIGLDRRFIPPPPQDVLGCLDAFEKHLHNTSTSIDSLVDCFMAHYQFECIHPFADGNGRIGRVLLSLMIQQRCRLSLPWLYLSAFFEKHRDEYIERLFQVSAIGDWTGWIDFCLRAAIEQAQDTIQRCDELQRIKAEFAESVQRAGGSVRLAQIVDMLFESPYVRTADLARRLNVTYPTADEDVRRLCDAGILQKLDQISRKTYFAPRILETVYAGLD